MNYVYCSRFIVGSYNLEIRFTLFDRTIAMYGEVYFLLCFS